MSWSISALFPAGLTEAERAMLADALGHELPPFPVTRPRAADVRAVMHSLGIAGRYWPHAQGWFYLASSPPAGPRITVDGHDLAVDDVGEISLQLRTEEGYPGWDGDDTAEIDAVHISRAEPHAVGHLIRAFAEAFGPLVVADVANPEPRLVTSDMPHADVVALYA